MKYLLSAVLLFNAWIAVLYIRCCLARQRDKRYIKYLYGRIIALAGDEQ